MICAADVLDGAIRHHAVAMNRTSLLNPDLLDVQRTAWAAMIPADFGGKLVLRDFQEAIDGLAREHTGSPQDVNPVLIVQRASWIAQDRWREALAVLQASENDMLLYTQLIEYRDRCQRGDTTAKAQLEAEIPKLIKLLDESGFNEPVIDTIVTRCAEIVKRATVMDIPALPAANDAEADAVVQAWGAGPLSE